MKRQKVDLNQSVDAASDRNAKGGGGPSYLKPIGCINCPRCMRKMMRVDGIEDALNKRKGKDETKRLRGAIRDLTKRSSSN